MVASFSIRAGFILAPAVFLASCTAGSYVRDADLEVEGILDELEREHIATRPGTVIQPRPLEEPKEEETAAGAEETKPEAKVFNLREVMRIATGQSRDFQSQREGLYLGILGLTLTRYNFGPKFSSALSYLYSNATGSDSAGTGTATLTGSDILPTGASLSVSASSALAGNNGVGLDDNKAYTKSITSSLTQKLWRGGDPDIAFEGLTQAERSAVYSVRSFELFREDFTIQVFNKYYGLVRQKRQLDNQRQNLAQVEFLRRRSEALFQVGRAPQLDVLRSRQQELSAKDGLIQAEESYQSAVASFRIFLGFPPDEPVEIADEQPEFAPVRIDEQSAVEAAIANRLDLLSAKQQLEDVERSVRIAKDGLSPDLDLNLSHTFSSPSADQFGAEPLKDQNWSASVSLGLPIDRKAERNSYRSALISLERQRRSYALTYDSTVEEVRRSLRQLRRAENAIDIQKMLIDSEQKRLKIAQIRFQAGQIGNRDVVEAQQGLLNAQNAYIEDLVTYEIARIQLKRDLGILFLDNDGMPLE